MFTSGIDKVGSTFFVRSISTQRNVQHFTRPGEKVGVANERRIDFDNSVIVNENKSVTVGPGVPPKNMHRGATDHANAIKGAKKERYHEGDMREQSDLGEKLQRENRNLLLNKAQDQALFDAHTGDIKA